jgi:hypothetical protein
MEWAKIITDHLPTMVTVVLAAGGIIWAISRNLTTVVLRVDAVADRVGVVETELKKMTDMLVTMARQDEQIKSLTHRADLADTQIIEMRRRSPQAK